MNEQNKMFVVIIMMYIQHRLLSPSLTYVSQSNDNFGSSVKLANWNPSRWHMVCLVELCAGLSKRGADLINGELCW